MNPGYKPGERFGISLESHEWNVITSARPGPQNARFAVKIDCRLAAARHAIEVWDLDNFKALRHHDRVNLLRSAAVDGVSGYRRYRSDQMATARLVHLLRSLDLPLDQVRAAVTAWTAGSAAGFTEVVRRHRRQVDARAASLRGVLHRIDHLLSEGLVTFMADLGTSATPTTKSPPGTGSITDARLLAGQLFNQTWRLVEQEGRTADDDDQMIHTAHASRYHWGQVRTVTPAQLARGEWLISRVYAVLGRAEPALYHARRVLGLCQHHDIGGFDLAFAHEALARASAVAGDSGRAREHTDQALAAAEDIADHDDRDLVLADLETIPGQPRYW
jgi:DNA-binding transcriptional MerR regulator